MRSLIHMGQHKTATTSIQHHLKSNREALLKRGLYVANSIAGYDAPSHFILNIYALKENRLSAMKERFLESAATKRCNDSTKVYPLKSPLTMPKLKQRDVRILYGATKGFTYSTQQKSIKNSKACLNLIQMSWCAYVASENLIPTKIPIENNTRTSV